MSAITHPILLHIGYPKTGTTWLQTQLFGRPALGFHLVDRRLSKNAFSDPLPLRFDLAASCALVETEIAAAHARGQWPVISQERLAGYSSLGGYDAKEIADRLRAALPAATVLIVLREQSRITLSLYQNRVVYNRYLSASLAEFLSPPQWQRGLSKLRPFEWSFFEYHRLIAYYQRLFGPDRVRVLLFEQFQREPQAFVAWILRCTALSLPAEAVATLPFADKVHGSLSGPTLALRRRANRIAGRRTISNPSVLIPLSKRTADRLQPFWFWLDRVLPDRLKRWQNARNRRIVRRLMGDRFRESNRVTAELTGLDLAAYGYDL